MTEQEMLEDLDRIHAELQAVYAEAYPLLNKDQIYDAREALANINSLTASLRKGKDGVSGKH